MSLARPRSVAPKLRSHFEVKGKKVGSVFLCPIHNLAFLDGLEINVNHYEMMYHEQDPGP